MTLITRTFEAQRMRRGAWVTCATLVAGILIGLAFADGSTQLVAWAWPSVVTAIPVGLVLALLARRWPSAVALGLTGLLVFSAGLLVFALFGSGPQPLAAALASVVLAGSLLVVTHRAGPLDILGGMLLAYGSAALIFELSIPLHALAGLR
jgi:hypothetical protein